MAAKPQPSFSPGRRWKIGFGWGHTWLDRFGKTGVTDSFLTRIQWVY